MINSEFSQRLFGDDRSASSSAGGAGSLGSTAKYVGHSGYQEARQARYRWQRHAAKLLGGQGRVGLCRYAVVSTIQGVGVDLNTYDRDDGSTVTRAAFSGLQTCGSVWLCPCCSARISETRRSEMNQLLAWGRQNGLVPMMMTLTARHGRDDDLRQLLDRLKDAKRRLHQHRAWKALRGQIVGSVTATEVTGGGRNGWHPHLHVIVLTRPGTSLEGLREPWLASLRKAGLEGAGAAFDVQNAAAAGNYIAKWGAAEELALAGQKKGRSRDSSTPMQLLAASCDEDDARAGQLWREYAAVFQGRRQLVWSNGLKALAGIGEVDDETAAQDDAQESEHIADIPHYRWKRGARDRRAMILNAAEIDGAAGVETVVNEAETGWREDVAHARPMGTPTGDAHHAHVDAQPSGESKRSEPAYDYAGYRMRGVDRITGKSGLADRQRGFGSVGGRACACRCAGPARCPACAHGGRGGADRADSRAGAAAGRDADRSRSMARPGY